MAEEKKAVSTGSEGSKTTGVPESLQRFVDAETGNVDFEKIAQSFREAEGKVTKASQEAATIKQAYDQVVSSLGKGAGADTVVGKEKVTGRKLTVEDIVEDPEGAIRGAARGEFENLAKPVVDMLIAVAHPEVAQVINEDGTEGYADPEFADALTKYMAKLPIGMRQAIANRDYATIDHVIKTVKGLRKKVAVESNEEPKTKAKTNFSESGKGPSRKSGGKIWKTSEIRNLIQRHPDKYAEQIDEITKAYEEDRVE